jgi:predicted short-subunit dehydrogenase-like oxidoreductase (DUF2520 family)
VAEITLNVIGCGRVGRTLARLWSQSGVFEIGDVFDHTLAKSHAAVAFIGGGHAVGSIVEMRRSGVWMLTPPDDQIVVCCMALAQGIQLAAGNIVFHCSGALPSSELATTRACGAAVASVHPLKSFADPAAAVQTFSGTRCAAEGDAAALAVLRPAFERIGASVRDIDAGAKMIYHAASVFASNYLTALLEAGARCHEQAGYSREDALRMMEPLARETLDNVFRLGTAQALTGPIARGDDAVVARQLAALAAWDLRIEAVYKRLGTIAVELARKRGNADENALAAIDRLLAGDTS